jgi:small-conductance mechanosensitive channel
VAYGTEIHRVREVLVEAMKKVRTKDQYGREIVDPAYGITIPFPQCDVHLIHEE